jgi:hypothetical protein
MQHGHGRAPLTWTCTMDMDMHHGHGHAPWTWTCTMDMDVDYYWTGALGFNMQKFVITLILTL